MSEAQYYTVGPVDESLGRFVSRHNTQQNIDSGNFLLTDDIKEAFIWNTQRFASLYCSQGNFRIKPVEVKSEDEEEDTYVVTATTFNRTGDALKRDISTLPALRGHRLVESSYETLPEALYVRNIIAREHPELIDLDVIEYSVYQAGIVKEIQARKRQA